MALCDANVVIVVVDFVVYFIYVIVVVVDDNVVKALLVVTGCIISGLQKDKYRDTSGTKEGLTSIGRFRK